MVTALAWVGEYAATLFGTSAAAGAAGTATVGAEVGAGIGTAATVASPALATAGVGAAGLASGAATAATAASALATLAAGRSGINIPPPPSPGIRNDQQIQDAQQQALKREQVAGGLQGSTGTPGGQAGAVLSPATTSSKSILGG